MRRSSKAFGMLCMASVLIAFAFLIGMNRPFSPIYGRFNTKDDILKKANSLNRVRFHRAMDYFNESKEIPTKAPKPKLLEGFLDIAVVVVTVARTDIEAEPKGYLIQTAASVDATLKTHTGTLKTMLAICDADNNPARHKEAVFLRKYIPYINRQDSNVVNKAVSYRALVKDSKLKDKRRIREIEDYVFCLNAARDLNSKYVLMLEDDVVPERDMLKVLEHTLARRLNYRHSGQNVLENIAYIKLYYPQRWQGFAKEGVRLAELLCVSLVGGIVFTICFAVFWGRYNGVMFKICIIQYLFWIVTNIIMAHIIGRVDLLELRRISSWTYKLGPSPACCTQAILYPAAVLPDLMQFLLVNNSLNKDLAINDYTLHGRELRGYQIEPNLFRHIGMYTSLSAASFKDPREFLFDMPFELGVS